MEWQSIETAPKDGRAFWAAERDVNQDGSAPHDWTYFMLRWSRQSGRWIYYRAGECWYALPDDTIVTHWRPLPEPPSMADEKPSDERKSFREWLSEDPERLKSVEGADPYWRTKVILEYLEQMG